MNRLSLSVLILMAAVFALSACGDDDTDGTIADLLYIGGICDNDAQCDDEDDATPELECLTEFTGGYCGMKDCESSDDCPPGSLCADLEGEFYCFLACTDKAECNTNRTAETASNCSANIDPVEGGGEKLCIPPSAG